MNKKRSTYTIRRLLTDAGELPMNNVPYGRLIMHTLPDEVEVYPTDTASHLLSLLEGKHVRYLDRLVEDLIDIEDGRTKRRVFRVIAWMMILGTMALLATIVYVSLVKREFPSWDQMMWCLGPSAWVVVDKFGALTKGKFKQMGEAIKTFKDKRGGRREEGTYTYEEQKYGDGNYRYDGKVDDDDDYNMRP